MPQWRRYCRFPSAFYTQMSSQHMGVKEQGCCQGQCCSGTILGRIPPTSGGNIFWLFSLGCNRKSGMIFFSLLLQRGQAWIPLYWKRRKKPQHFPLKKDLRTNAAVLFLNILLAEEWGFIISLGESNFQRLEGSYFVLWNIGYVWYM